MICNNCHRETGDKAVCPYCHNSILKAPLPHHLPYGTVIGGKYIIKGVLGEGGFGITYLGFDSVLERKVAVKEYFSMGLSCRDSAVSPDVVCRSREVEKQFLREKENFLKEAKTIAGFSDDPGIVDVRDFVEENNTAYIIMEYLDGETLSEHLKRRGRMDPVESFTIMLPIISALEKIHAAGVIHRDISPDNIMMLHNGQLRLMDFGAAKNFINNSSEMFVILKRGYAPPEQYVRGGKLTPAADVYALCATIYKCITGITPVDSTRRIPDDPLKKPSQLGVAIPNLLEELLMNGLRVETYLRCPDMTDLKRMISGALRVLAVQQPDPVPSEPDPVPEQQPPEVQDETEATLPGYSISLKLWIITMLIGTVITGALIPVYAKELSDPVLWTGVVGVVFLCQIFSCSRVFRPIRSERAKNAFTAAVIFFTVLFIGVICLLPADIFLF